MNGNSIKSVGELLRSAREEGKFTLDDVNRQTRISIGVLKQLEQDDFDSFESDIYLKNFLKNYANFLGIDAGHILTTLERQRGGVISPGGALWDIEETLTEETLKSPRIIRRFVLPILIILVLVLSLLLLRMYKRVKTMSFDGTGDPVRTERIEHRA
jgi:cytoskeletal protein RodZ